MYEIIFIYYLQECPSGKYQQCHGTSTFNNLSWNSGGKFRAGILSYPKNCPIQHWLYLVWIGAPVHVLSTYILTTILHKKWPT